MQLPQFKQLVEDMFTQKSKIDRMNVNLGIEKETLEDMKLKISNYLEQVDLRSFKGQSCTVTNVQKASNKTPKDNISKDAFLNYVKENYDYDRLLSLISVNSAKLNVFCSEAEAKAVEAGDLDFKIPGLEEPKYYTQLSIRKV